MRSTNPGASTISAAPRRAISASTSPRWSPSPNTTPRRPGTDAAAATTALTTAGARFSGMWRPANTTTGSAVTGAAASAAPSYSPDRTVTSPRSPSSRRRPACRRENA